MGFEMDWSTLFAISDLSDTPWWQYMLGGAGITLALTFSAGLLALVVGTLVGIIRTVPNRALNFIGEAWVELFRNVPLLVQLFLCGAGIHPAAEGVDDQHGSSLRRILLRLDRPRSFHLCPCG